MRKGFNRRDVLKGTTALTLAGYAAPIRAQVTSGAPAADTITPELIAAAKKEGRVVYYTAIDLVVAERIAKAFEAKFGVPACSILPWFITQIRSEVVIASDWSWVTYTVV